MVFNLFQIPLTCSVLFCSIIIKTIEKFNVVNEILYSIGTKTTRLAFTLFYFNEYGKRIHFHTTTFVLYNFTVKRNAL